MGIFDKIIERTFGYGGIKEPIFLKDFDSEAKPQIASLGALIENVIPENKEIIEQEILKIRSGLNGESNVYFELKNSRIPCICLHDIRLEYKGLTAQIDFIVIAAEFILVIETKRLYGDIAIDDEGNFNREYNFKGRKFKEGIYSPITQNERHIALLSEMLKDNKFIRNLPMLSLVVIANDKTIISKKFAKQDIKSQVIKHDQLIGRLNEFKKLEKYKITDANINEIAKYLLSNHKPIEFDYINKLGLTLLPQNITPIVAVIEEIPIQPEVSKTDEPESTTKLHDQLRSYRAKTAKAQSLKPYYVFNNVEMDSLVSKQPTTKDEFLSIHGFGEKKYQDYGENIIEIIVNHRNGLYELLKQYRVEKAKQLNLKAYEIFSNQQLDDIIRMVPSTKDDFKQIKYFNQGRIDHYADDIIEIIHKNW